MFSVELISHEDIITELAADTLESGAGLGVGGGNFSPGSFSQVACLSLKVHNYSLMTIEMHELTDINQWTHPLITGLYTT